MSRQLRSATKAVGKVTQSTPTATTATAKPKAKPLTVESPSSDPVATSKSQTTLAIRLFEDAKAWESWLEQHHQTETDGLWLKISKKGSSVPSVSYADALDAALCFGWIDGQRKTHDKEHFLQRFTPRRRQSLWSRRNVDKVAVLIAQGRMRDAGQAEIEAAKADGRWEKAYASSSTIEVPEDFQVALNRNKRAKAFFDTLTKTKRYPFLWRIETVKRAETRQKKIDQFVKLLAEHKTL